LGKKIFIEILILVPILAYTYGCIKKENGDSKPTTKYLNLDFEDSTPDGKPKYWMAGGMDYEALVDKTDVNSGKACLRLESISANRTFGVATSFFPIDFARGKKLRYTGFIKTEDVKDGHAGLWWRVDGAKQSNVLAFDNMADRGPKETTDWQEYVIELDIPEDGSNINFGVLLVGMGKAWFDNLQIFLDGEPYQQTRLEPIVPKRADLKWIRNHAIPVETADPTSGHADLVPLKDMIGERRIVALGEGTHGTSEFFKMKHRIVRFLAEEMGFTVFAIEANMPEARQVNWYVLTGEGDPKKALSGLYFWTWDTSEVLAMIEWMKEFNLSGRGRMEFYGFDMQFPDVAVENVRAFVGKADPEFAAPLKDYYGQVEEVSKSMRNVRDRSQIDFEKWYDAAQQVYGHLKSRRDFYAESLDALEVDWAIQDALVVLQAAEANMQGKRSRDESMADNLDWILAHTSPGTKVVTWAHNGHVSKNLGTFKSMGYYLSERHGEDMVVFGFAFHSGEYTAVGKNGINVYGTSLSEPGSVEWFLKSSGIPQMILDLREASGGDKGARWLMQELDFRSIGAMAMDYAFSPRKITEEFDALIYFTKTTPSECFRSQNR
jgi:erythromycin esterase